MAGIGATAEALATHLRKLLAYGGIALLSAMASLNFEPGVRRKCNHLVPAQSDASSSNLEGQFGGALDLLHGDVGLEAAYAIDTGEVLGLEAAITRSRKSQSPAIK